MMKQSIWIFLFLASGLVAQQEERINGWRSDLEILIDKMEEEHYDLFHTISPEEWKKATQQLYNDIPKKSDLQLVGAFMKLMAMIGDGHTLMYPPFQGKNTFLSLPLEFYFFEDDVYIRAAEPKYEELVGTKVVKVGSMEIDEIIQKTVPHLGRDNEFQLKWIIPIAMMFSDLYQIIGTIEDRNQVNFTLMKEDGSIFSRKVAAGVLTRDPMSRFAPDHWKSMVDRKSNFWTKNPDNFYWYEWIPDDNVVYCQFNQVRNNEKESIEDFSKKLHSFIKEKNAVALIIDIRLNNGGNSFLNKAFIHEIIKNEAINQEGKLFTIIGRRTFSAAMNLSSDLENHTNTLFVGEQTGSKPNFIGEDNEFVLPYSELMGSISTRYWQGGATSDDDRQWIAPDLEAPLTVDDYKNNIDPCMKRILDYVKHNSK